MLSETVINDPVVVSVYPDDPDVRYPVISLRATSAATLLLGAELLVTPGDHALGRLGSASGPEVTVSVSGTDVPESIDDAGQLILDAVYDHDRRVVSIQVTDRCREIYREQFHDILAAFETRDHFHLSWFLDESAQEQRRAQWLLELMEA